MERDGRVREGDLVRVDLLAALDDERDVAERGVLEKLVVARATGVGGTEASSAGAKLPTLCQRMCSAVAASFWQAAASGKMTPPRGSPR